MEEGGNEQRRLLRKPQADLLQREIHFELMEGRKETVSLRAVDWF